MPPPKRKGKGKTKGTKAPQSLEPRPTEKRWSPRLAGAATALGGAALALGWTRLVQFQSSPRAARTDVFGGEDNHDHDHDHDHDFSSSLLTRVRKSGSFKLAGSHNRTLSATADIPSGTVLMEIPRSLMIWDLDAARDDFVKAELFRASLGGGSGDQVAKRAALLSAYLALLRNEVVSPLEFPLHASVAGALPSYQEYASFHPVLADLERVKLGLGEHSPAFLHLVHVRDSLNGEYDSFVEASSRFAGHVSREEYLACRLAVQSRAFQIPGMPESEVPKAEREYYRQTIQIDFGAGVVSIEPVNDWMNSHVNNNVKVGGYDPVKRTGQAWATKTIPKGQELINDYGSFYDFALFSQYGFVPSDGTGTTFASLFVHHDINLMDGLQGEIATSTNALMSMPPPEKMLPYLQHDYGYRECIQKETHPEAFELKRLKVMYLQQIALDSSRWVLPLPPRTSTDVTPPSTTALSDDYEIPSFGPNVYEYLESQAPSASLPCRLITLTHRDLDDAVALLTQDLETLDQSSSHQETPMLRLEELEVDIFWMIRTIHCMNTLASAQKLKYGLSVEDQERHIMTLAENGNVNTLEWNTAHVKLEEMQSQEALETWALDVLDSVAGIETESPDDLVVHDEPCPEQYTAELLLN